MTCRQHLFNNRKSTVHSVGTANITLFVCFLLLRQKGVVAQKETAGTWNLRLRFSKRNVSSWGQKPSVSNNCCCPRHSVSAHCRNATRAPGRAGAVAYATDKWSRLKRKSPNKQTKSDAENKAAGDKGATERGSRSSGMIDGAPADGDQRSRGQCSRTKRRLCEEITSPHRKSCSVRPMIYELIKYMEAHNTSYTGWPLSLTTSL